MTPLIDATEMYLRTVWELDEEGITPLRARLVERLNLSAPAVSETVARLSDEGLMRMTSDRTLELTEHGRQLAVSVMRKHRLAEKLLTDVIGLEWEQAHNEACRWEHVISDSAEQHIAAVLGEPDTSPYGNPIPGSGEVADSGGLSSMAEAAKRGGEATVARISEALQVDVDALRFLRDAGLVPGARAEVELVDGTVQATVDGETVTVPEDVAELVAVTVE